MYKAICGKTSLFPHVFFGLVAIPYVWLYFRFIRKISKAIAMSKSNYLKLWIFCVVDWHGCMPFFRLYPETFFQFTDIFHRAERSLFHSICSSVFVCSHLATSGTVRSIQYLSFLSDYVKLFSKQKFDKFNYSHWITQFTKFVAHKNENGRSERCLEKKREEQHASHNIKTNDENNTEIHDTSYEQM